MPSKVIELYSSDELHRMEERNRHWIIGLSIFSIAALAVCISFALRTRTLNAMQMELSAVAVSTVAGWIVLYFALFRVRTGRREIQHAVMLQDAERDRYEGTVSLQKEQFLIRKSVPVQRVEVRDENGEVARLLICRNKSAALAQARPTAVYVTHGYVAAYEVAQ